MPLQPNGLAPYAPPATVLSIIDRARDRGLPAPVTNEVLMRAQVTESLVPRVLNSLQLLELINEDGTWTENLETLRRAPANEIQTRLTEIIRSVYADVFQYIDPAKADRTAVRDAFRSYTPHGQQDRMVILFMGLCRRAGIVPEGATRTISRDARPIRKPAPQNPVIRNKPNTARQEQSNLPAPLAGLLATLPQAGWTKNDRDRFMGAFTAMLDYCIPVRSQAEIDKEELT